MNRGILKTIGMLLAAAFIMTACTHNQKGASVANAAEVSDEETAVMLGEVAGIVMSGPVAVQTIASREPGAAVAVATSASAEAVITSINAAKRIIMLKTQDGETRKFIAGPEVKYFDKLKVGDTVVVTFTEIMAVYLGEESAPSADLASNLARKGDETPGAALIYEAQITSKVLELDKATRRMKLELPENVVSEVTVRDGVDLSKVKVGDSLTIATATALVIDVAQ